MEINPLKFFSQMTNLEKKAAQVVKTIKGKIAALQATLAAILQRYPEASCGEEQRGKKRSMVDTRSMIDKLDDRSRSKMDETLRKRTKGSKRARKKSKKSVKKSKKVGRRPGKKLHHTQTPKAKAAARRRAKERWASMSNSEKKARIDKMMAGRKRKPGRPRKSPDLAAGWKKNRKAKA